MSVKLPALARRLALALLAGCAVTWPAAAQSQVVDLYPRSGVTLRYLALAPAGAPKAAVILFTGSQGLANIPDKPGPTWAQNGAFVVRAREHFRQHGLYVAVIDAPSDYKPKGLGGARLSAEHADDVAAVIADLRKRSPGVPVWLVGTSRGTVSATNAAARLQPPRAADGLVLTSAVTRAGGGRQLKPGTIETVFDADLPAIRVPTLVVAHHDDTCTVTPPADAASIVKRLSNAPVTKIISMDGGDPPRSEPCEALSAHGFLGREAETVKAIADWILAPKS
jgi:pimeloyl-ACP methyl ester carboxylesterase